MMNNNTMVNENSNNVEKLTKKDCFNLLAEIVMASGSEHAEKLLSFIQNELSLMEKKASKAKEKKANGADSGIRENVLAVLADNEEPITVSMMMEDSRLTTYNSGETVVKMSNQKLTSMLTRLKNEGLVKKEVIKKASHYSLVR